MKLCGCCKVRSFPGHPPPPTTTTNLFKPIDDFGDPDIWMLLDSSLQICMLLNRVSVNCLIPVGILAVLVFFSFSCFFK